MKRRVFFVWPGHPQLSKKLRGSDDSRGAFQKKTLSYIPTAFVLSLNAAGYDARICSEAPQDIAQGDVIISINPREARRCKAFMLFLCLNPFRVPDNIEERMTRKGHRFSAWVRTMYHSCKYPKRRWYDGVLCYDRLIMDVFRRFGVPVALVPIGYHESFEVSAKAGEEGVFFLGCTSTRRNDLVEKCGAQYVPHSRREEILNTPGVHLAIHASGRAFDSIRIVSLLLSNRRCVLSDGNAEWWPLVPGAHLFATGDRYLSMLCKDLMKNATIREEVGQMGYEFVKERFRLDTFLLKAFDQFGLTSCI